MCGMGRVCVTEAGLGSGGGERGHCPYGVLRSVYRMTCQGQGSPRDPGPHEKSSLEQCTVASRGLSQCS